MLPHFLHPTFLKMLLTFFLPTNFHPTFSKNVVNLFRIIEPTFIWKDESNIIL
jgi:hypothetical protein